MIRGLYTAAMGMMDTQQKQDATANNIANSTTTGYKQDKIVSKPFHEVMVQNMGGSEFGEPALQRLGTMPFGVKSDEAYTDFNQGSFQDTGRDLDFAIGGGGFFTLSYFDGIAVTPKYTRDGSFLLDSQGRITTSQGGYVQARNLSTNQIGPIEAGTGTVTVDENGRVYIDSQLKYSLIITDFDNYEAIEKTGQNMYSTRDGENPSPRQLTEGQYSVNQGKLEQSNVDISEEMVSMITNLRNYQANQRVLKSIDETLGKAVNEVGSLK